MALTALSAASGWWPSEEGGGAPLEAHAEGRSFCGALADGRPGAVRLETTERSVEIPLSALSVLRPVDGRR